MTNESRILAALAENRSATSFDPPDSLAQVIAGKLHVYAPTSAQWDEAFGVEAHALGNFDMPQDASGPHIMMALAKVTRRARRAKYVHLVARCVHYQDEAGELRPLGPDVVAAMSEGDVADLCDQLENAVSLVDPQIEELSQSDYEKLRDGLKKKGSVAQVAEILKSTDIATLRSFTLSMASELFNFGT